MKNFLSKGYYGYYNYAYAQTVYLLRKLDQQIINYFTLITCIEDKSLYKEENLKFGNLNKQYSYGIHKRIESLKWLRDLERDIRCKGEFTDNGKSILIGKVKLIPQQLVTSNVESSPYQLTVGKYASYIWEFFDLDKDLFKDILESNADLETLNQKLDENGIRLIDQMERIGNLLIEFPNDLIVDLERIDDTDLKIIWDKRFQDQDKIKAILTKESNTINDYRIVDINSDQIIFSERKKHQRVKLIATDRNVVLLDNHNCKGFSATFTVAQHLDSRRIISETKEEIVITKTPGYGSAGDPIDKISSKIEDFRTERKIRDNLISLKYKQYPISFDLNKEQRHESGLSDLNYLIRVHGDRGFSIWDPFLSAKDLYSIVVKTYNNTSNVRALGSKKIYISGVYNIQPEQEKSKREKWFDEQKEILEMSSNHVGLNLEFRCAYSTKESMFHDRFLLFNEVGLERKPKVWSLGISINQFGTEHHVLHEVEFPRFIIQAFENLWESLEDEKYLVFKKEYAT